MTDTAGRYPYDEFSMFQENAEEFGIPYSGPPVVERRSVELGDGRQMSSLVWGGSDPELVLLHGGAQNAHTWDTVALALARPLVAIDLPAHGHSDGAKAATRSNADNADDMAAVIGALAPASRAVVGMSMGGITALALAERHPDLVPRLVLVDVTPGVNPEKAKAITDFVRGPASFPDFDAILARTASWRGRWSTTRPAPSRRCGAASCTTRSNRTTGAGSGGTPGTAPPIRRRPVTPGRCRICGRSCPGSGSPSCWFAACGPSRWSMTQTRPSSSLATRPPASSTWTPVTASRATHRSNWPA
jgi:pimeloyl-ACP methyl ester carboxylesterase